MLRDFEATNLRVLSAERNYFSEGFVHTHAELVSFFVQKAKFSADNDGANFRAHKLTVAKNLLIHVGSFSLEFRHDIS